MIFYGLLNGNTEKPYRVRTQAHPFSTETEKTPSKESVEKTKNGGPVADIDRKQAPGGGGEIRTHVPVRTT